MMYGWNQGFCLQEAQQEQLRNLQREARQRNLIALVEKGRFPRGVYRYCLFCVGAWMVRVGSRLQLVSRAAR
jgi:hypothetical protein